MSRQVVRVVVCAAVLLLTAAGCSLDAFRLSSPSPAGEQLVVAGTRSQVSSRIQEALADAGIPVLEKRQGSDVTFTGLTRARKVFTLILRHEKLEEGEKHEKTRILVKWDREADEEFWSLVVQALT